MTDRTSTDAQRKHCDVEGCGKPARSRTAELCPMHYHRVYRYGSLTPVHPPRFEDMTGRRFGTLVVTERRGQQWLCQCDCGQTRVANVGDLNRHANANTCGTKRNHLAEIVDYTGAHGRVRARWGSASNHRCVGCGGAARHWSYDHTDPDELISQSGWTRGIAYSLDPDRYQPRCVPCHKRFDLDHLNGTPAQLLRE